MVLALVGNIVSSDVKCSIIYKYIYIYLYIVLYLHRITLIKEVLVNS